eukprot:849123-Prymnesium_polylepis.2
MLWTSTSPPPNRINIILYSTQHVSTGIPERAKPPSESSAVSTAHGSVLNPGCRAPASTTYVALELLPLSSWAPYGRPALCRCTRHIFQLRQHMAGSAPSRRVPHLSPEALGRLEAVIDHRGRANRVA